MRRVLVLALAVLVLTSSLALAGPQVIAVGRAATTVHFTTGDVSVGGIVVRVDLCVSVEVKGLLPYIPPFLISGFGGDIKVAVKAENATVSITYAGTPYTKEFLTPIGSTTVPVAEVAGLGTLYIRATGRVRANATLRGPVTQAAELSWPSEGEQAIHVEHGPITEDPTSMLAFGVIKLTLVFWYELDLVVGAEYLGSTIFEHEVPVGGLEGTPNVEESIWLVPAIPALGGLILLIVIIAAVRRGRAKPYGRYRWVRCPRCGYEFAV